MGVDPHWRRFPAGRTEGGATSRTATSRTGSKSLAYFLKFHFQRENAKPRSVASVMAASSSHMAPRDNAPSFCGVPDAREHLLAIADVELCYPLSCGARLRG